MEETISYNDLVVEGGDIDDMLESALLLYEKINEGYSIIDNRARLIAGIKLFGIKLHTLHLVNKNNELGRNLNLILPCTESIDIVDPELDIVDIDETIVIESLSSGITVMKNWLLVQIEKLLKAVAEIYKKFFDYYKRIEKNIEGLKKKALKITADQHSKFLSKRASIIRYHTYEKIINHARGLSRKKYLKNLLEDMEKKTAQEFISANSSHKGNVEQIRQYLNDANLVFNQFGISGVLKSINNQISISFIVDQNKSYIENLPVEELGWTYDIVIKTEANVLDFISLEKEEKEKPIFINNFIRSRKLHDSWNEEQYQTTLQPFLKELHSGLAGVIAIDRKLEEYSKKILNMYCYLLELLTN